MKLKRISLKLQGKKTQDDNDNDGGRDMSPRWDEKKNLMAKEGQERWGVEEDIMLTL